MLGEYGQIACRVFSSISNVGSCLAYIAFFEMYVATIIQEYWSHKIADEQAHLIGALCAFIVILPLSTINNVALFWHTNFVGLFLGLLGLVAMMYNDFSLIASTGTLHWDE